MNSKGRAKTNECCFPDVFTIRRIPVEGSSLQAWRFEPPLVGDGVRLVMVRRGVVDCAKNCHDVRFGLPSEPTWSKAVPMSFGKNPHVAKAQAAEQKAQDAPDEHARASAYREAGRLWERAAERESPGKRRSEYERNAIRARALADGEGDGDNDNADGAVDPKLLN